MTTGTAQCSSNHQQWERRSVSATTEKDTGRDLCAFLVQPRSRILSSFPHLSLKRQSSATDDSSSRFLLILDRPRTLLSLQCSAHQLSMHLLRKLLGA